MQAEVGGGILSGLSYAQLISTYTLAAGNISGNPFYQTSDAGLWYWNGAQWVQQTNYTVLQSSIPMALQSSGVVGANGAITLTTALPSVYSGGIYLALWPSQVYANSPGGLWFAIMSSTTAGTVYNNWYLGGQPTIPASPNAIVAAAPNGLGAGTITNGGTGYDGGGTATYSNVSLTTTTGSGSGAKANITVTAGVVTAVVITTTNGLNYSVGDTLSATVASLGNNGGSGFVFTVSANGYTQVTANPINMQTANIPANVMGLNGEISIEYVWQVYTGSTSSKNLSCVFGGQNLSNTSALTNTSQWNNAMHSIRNSGVTNVQTSINSQPIGDYLGTGTAVSHQTVDTTVGQVAGLRGNLATSPLDWMVFESISVKVTPSTVLDNPTTPVAVAASAAIVPPGAAALGCNVNKFFQNVTAASIDFAETNNGPLFARLYYQTKPTSALGFNANSGYASTVNGKLRLTGGPGGAGGYAGGIVTTANPTNGTSSLPLLSSANKWYAEFAMQCDSNTNLHFDAVWMLPNEHGFPGVTTYVEVDVFEGGGAQDNYNPVVGMQSTTIQWTSGVPSSLRNVNGVYLDRTQEHIFGAGYDPTAAKIYFWLDGVLQYTRDVSSFNSTMNTYHYYLLFNWGTHVANGTLTFTGAPTGTSATLNANWALPSGNYGCAFSTGELRMITLTQGATTATWANALQTAPTATVTYANDPHSVYLRYLSGWSTV